MQTYVDLVRKKLTEERTRQMILQRTRLANAAFSLTQEEQQLPKKKKNASTPKKMLIPTQPGLNRNRQPAPLNLQINNNRK